MGLICGICFLQILFSSAVFGLDPYQSLGQLHHTSWTARDGLNGSVQALAQTADGYLWIGTTDGLYRFDGLSFDRYQPERSALPSSSVSALLALPHGGLWIGYDRGGATFLKDGTATNYSQNEGFPVSTVRCFAEDWDGTIWAAVMGGFTRLEGQHWHRVRSERNYPDKSAWTLLVDRQGTLWVASGTRILYLSRGEKRFRDMGLETGRVTAMTQGPDGTLFVADSDRKAPLAFRSPLDRGNGPLPTIGIQAQRILFDRDGAMWMAETGLARVSFPKRKPGRQIFETSPRAERLTEDQGLSDNDVHAMMEDREGNIWVGTEGGLDRFRYRNLNWFPLPPKVRNFSFVAGDHGEVWTGSRADEPRPMMRVPDGKFGPGGPLSVYMTYRDPDGAIWISARNSFLRWRGASFTEIQPPEAMKKMHRSPTRDPMIVSSVTRDSVGNLWVAYGGLGEFQLSQGAWKHVDVLSDHPDWASNAAYTDAAGRIWLAYGDRVAVVDHGNTRTFSASEGLTVGPFIIIEGRDNQVWVGGEAGLAFLARERFHTLHLAAGVELGSVTGIVVPANDGIWLSAIPGIVHIPEREVSQVLRHFDYKPNCEIFDLISDLPEPLQAYESYSSHAIQATDGMLWFATRGGAARVNPAHIVMNSLPPPVSIRSIVADEKSYWTYGKIELPALTRNLRIDYAALSLMIPERVRFRYKLQNSERDWQDVGTRRQAFYSNLRPGRYTFRVIASNNDGVWNDHGAAVELSVAPAWFQTAWFGALCFLAALGVVWVLYWIRICQVRHAIHARFDERLSERTRLARELHDTVLQTIQGSKMVADDALDGPADPARMRSTLEHLSTWLGQAVQEGRAALNALRVSTIETNDLAEAFRRATETHLIPTSMTAGFAVTGSAREMHPIIRDEIYRIGHEAIRNACLHSQASRLEVELSYAKALILRVSDNGVGIDPGRAEKAKDGHFGLQGMRERAARIGATFTLTSSATSGTEIKLVVPGATVFRVEGGTGRIKSLLQRLLDPFRR
jgi:signal transduction histidine kinase/ligand-binding sensor domain-containing protein